MQNKSLITNVFVIGLNVQQHYRLFLFCMFLVTYALTFTCNLLIILLVLVSRLSGSPMYIFLSNLSLSEIFLTTDIIPPMLYITLRNGAVFSLVGCFIQFFLFGVFVVTESFLLSAMSYDRFLAICKPLHYTMIMGPKSCLCLILTCWTMGFLTMIIALMFVRSLYFCKENIDHFYCDVIPILKLACSDTSIVEMVAGFLSSSATLFPFLVIISTYFFIIRAVTKISSSVGKEKAFSTCSSHLGVVFSYYTTMIIVYVIPPGHYLTANKIVSLLYTVITPLVNPFIYTLRNQEIHAAMRQASLSLSRSKNVFV